MSLEVRGVSGEIFIHKMTGNKEISYGMETVSKVKSSGDVILNGTTVTGEVSVNGSITATKANFASAISVTGGATITSSICQEEVSADCDIIATETTTKALSAGRDITVIKCVKLGAINAGVDVEAEECPSIQSVSAGNHITLRQSNV
ncbi:MAG TPA: hypothetical protein VIH61_08840, partial [Waddliaceae bacterium]